MKICFLDNTNFQYNSRDLYSNKLRGAEAILINLSKALNESGNQITIFVNYHNIQSMLEPLPILRKLIFKRFIIR